MKSGVEVDIVTGLPIDERKGNVVHKAEVRRQRLVNEHDRLVNDLCGSGGELLKKVISLYINRVDSLISADPVCVEYQAIFDSIGLTLSAGKEIVNAKVEKITKDT